MDDNLKWSDESRALHWIDRYAAGIDADPQMDRILECVEAHGSSNGALSKTESSTDIGAIIAKVPTAEKVTEDWGDRCPDHDPDCFSCQIWAALDAVSAMRNRLEELGVELCDLQDRLEVHQGDPITLAYTNWRGETAERSILPKRVWFGSTDWHPERQWLLTATDCDKQAERDFALKDFGSASPTFIVAGEQWRAFEDGVGYTAWYPVGYGNRPTWEALVKRNPERYAIKVRTVYALSGGADGKR